MNCCRGYLLFSPVILKARFTYYLLLLGSLLGGIQPELLGARQDSLKRWFPFDQAELSYHSGIIMPHVPAIDFMTNDYTSGLDLRLLHNSDGSRGWHHLFHYPRLGLGYHHGSLGNKQVYGQAHSLYGFFEAPAITISPGTALHYRMSAGLSYITKTFDVQNNLYNIAIGSHLNLHYQLSMLATIRLTNEYQLVAGIGLNHFSNGKIQSPNKGLNLISGSLGVRYTLYEPDKSQKTEPIPDLPDKNHFSLIWSHGLKDYNRFQPAVYYISSMNLSYERQYARMAKYGMGLDAFYNPSLKNHLPASPANDLTHPALYRLGVHLSHDVIVGDFSLTLQLGHYIYNRVFYITDLYNRIGLKYYGKKHLILNVSLKSHNANAEFIEFGIGYQW